LKPTPMMAPAWTTMRADRDVAAGGGVVGEAQGLAHVHEVEVGRREHARGASRKSAKSGNHGPAGLS
jgi:hypothetical protein